MSTVLDVVITEKSFGNKSLMKDVKFTVGAKEKVGVVGRNGAGKSTLFGILAGTDKDYSGDVIFRRGSVVTKTAQEHIGLKDVPVLGYILNGLPEYEKLQHIINTYPETMGDDIKKIEEFSQALDKFNTLGYYHIEDKVKEEMKAFQLEDAIDKAMSQLSGGQKRLVEVIKVMHANADLALIDEPTNHMDYVAKEQFVSWMKTAPEAMLVITHDRDVLEHVDRIVELKDGVMHTYNGNYDAYLKQNATKTATGMSDFEQIEKRIKNLETKVLDYQRLKEKSRNPSTIQKFKRLEQQSREELNELKQMEKPSFWIDRSSVDALDYKSADRYQKFKAKNIKMNVKENDSRSTHLLARVDDLTLAYGDKTVVEEVSFILNERERLEIRGRNGAGKSSVIKALLGSEGAPQVVRGELFLDKQVRIGLYHQEIHETYINLPLDEAIEKMYLDRDLAISDTKIRNLLSDYLFTEGDRKTPLSRLSGGQKARFQIISMLASEPQLLILDEPTNHLDLPSIEELENALSKYTGAVLFVSHDSYFRKSLKADVVMVGAK